MYALKIDGNERIKWEREKKHQNKQCQPQL